MSITLLLFGLIVLLLVVLSIRERVRWRTMRDKNWDAIGEAKTSPLSQAIVNLVGTAGGIYLSLVLLQTFLEVNMPRSIALAGMDLEPLASIAIALAIIQPFIARFWLKKR
nr:hypothetical protein [Desulfotruncus arcticus]